MKNVLCERIKLHKLKVQHNNVVINTLLFVVATLTIFFICKCNMNKTIVIKLYRYNNRLNKIVEVATRISALIVNVATCLIKCRCTS